MSRAGAGGGGVRGWGWGLEDNRAGGGGDKV